MLNVKIRILLILLVTSPVTYSFSSQPETDSIIVQDGGVFIAEQEAQSIIDSIDFNTRMQLSSDETRLKTLLLNELTLKKMSSEAEKLGLQNDPIITQKIRKATRNILANALVENHRSSVQITEDLDEYAQEYYQTNIEEFTSIEKVKVAHILLKSNSSNEKEVHTKAVKLLSEIKNGLDFSEAAKEYSEDKSNAKDGGILDFFSRGRMVPNFENAAFKLQKPGELSDLVKTKFGYHIIKFIDREKPTLTSFEKAKPNIVTKLKAKLAGEELSKYRDSFHSSESTKLFIPALNKFSEKLKNIVNDQLNNINKK